MKIVYYTSGTPGTGRIVQGISIHNALSRRGLRCDFVIVSGNPLASLADSFSIAHIEIPLEEEDAFTRHNYSESILYKTLAGLNPDLLIVDRVWFTLYHFIHDMPCKKIFLSIQVRDDFFELELPEETLYFNNAQYDRVLAIEPFKSSVDMDLINPILIRNRNEIYSRDTALEKLGLDGSRPVGLVALNFKEGYFEHLRNKYSYLEYEYNVVYTTNLKGGGIFPIVDYYNAIDFIVCAAGYTQFWEVIYFRKEAVFETFPMRFTDMEWRVRECLEYSFNENGADQLAEIIANL